MFAVLSSLCRCVYEDISGGQSHLDTTPQSSNIDYLVVNTFLCVLLAQRLFLYFFFVFVFLIGIRLYV